MILVKKVLSKANEQFVVMRRTKLRSYYYCGDEPLAGGGVKRVWSLRRDRAIHHEHERVAHDTVERLRQTGDI